MALTWDFIKERALGERMNEDNASFIGRIGEDNSGIVTFSSS